VEAVLSDKEGPDATGALRPVLHPGASAPGEITTVPLARDRRSRPDGSVTATSDPPGGREALQRAMTDGAGVVRTAESLDGVRSMQERIAADGVPPGELSNLITVGGALVAAASAREESRGGHRRADFPETVEAFSSRFVQ